MDLEAKLALVTGGGSGLGRAIAVGLARRGAQVVVADVDGEAAEQTCATLRATGSLAWPLVVDVRDPFALARLVDTAAGLGRLSALINNAGGWTTGDQYPQAQPDAWAATLRLNLEAPMMLTQLCLDPMRRIGGGVVINIASGAAMGTDAYGSPEYAAAKAGLIRFTSSLADLPSTHNVRLACVIPDWIGLDRAKAQLAAMTPEQRAAAPPLIPTHLVVDAVLDLIDDDAASGTLLELRGV